MRKGEKFVWNKEREKSFEELKKRLFFSPILTLPSSSGGFQIYSDASKKGLGLADIFQQEIVRLHGTPAAIVSDRDSRFTSCFWKGLQSAWGTRLKFSMTFHLEIDGQTEQTIQTLEDMLRSCALEWTRN
nr:putative reverse transcriptase domain-containing protein [Tanacetum cinerariifolium]